MSSQHFTEEVREGLQLMTKRDIHQLRGEILSNIGPEKYNELLRALSDDESIHEADKKRLHDHLKNLARINLEYCMRNPDIRDEQIEIIGRTIAISTALHLRNHVYGLAHYNYEDQIEELSTSLETDFRSDIMRNVTIFIWKSESRFDGWQNRWDMLIDGFLNGLKNTYINDYKVQSVNEVRESWEKAEEERKNISQENPEPS